MLHGLAGALRGPRPPAPSSVVAPERVTRTDTSPTKHVVDRFRADVVARGTFSADWFTDRVERWETFLPDLEQRPTRALEIGSYEGLSACFVLWRLPLSTITCVDTFAGGIELMGSAELEGLESRFEANVALVDQARVRKVKGDSRRVLLDLLQDEDLFDLVYVDGSHRALDVIVDAALAWQLLAPGGVLVFDDYLWDRFEEPLLRPAPAVDAFRGLVGDSSETLFSGLQVALRRRA
jgi:SAM-dependent methyltransferase